MIIGLNGRAGAGKDTTAGFIREWCVEQRFTFKCRGFADALKLSAARIFYPNIGLEDAIAWCNALKEAGEVTVGAGKMGEVSCSGREFLQHYGTEAHRNVFGSDFWIRMGFVGETEVDFLVITDVRFTNEAEAISQHGGVVWEVARPGGLIAPAHVSEKPLPEHLIDRTIVNVGSLRDLRKKVFEVMLLEFGHAG